MNYCRICHQLTPLLYSLRDLPIQVVSQDKWSPKTGGLPKQVVSKDRWSHLTGELMTLLHHVLSSIHSVSSCHCTSWDQLTVSIYNFSMICLLFWGPHWSNIMCFNWTRQVETVVTWPGHVTTGGGWQRQNTADVFFSVWNNLCLRLLLSTNGLF